MLAIVTTLVCSAGSWVQDLPPDSELGAQVALGKLYGDVTNLVEELSPLQAVLPPGPELSKKLAERLQGLLDVVRRSTALNLSHKNVTLSAWVDLDASGGWVWGMVVRGAPHETPAAAPADTPQIETFDLEGQAASRVNTVDLAWLVRPDGTLLVGNERGLTRALHQLLSPEPLPKGLFASLSQRLAKPGLATLVFVPPAPQRTEVASSMTTIAPFVREVQALSVDGAPGRITVRLVAQSDKGQRGLVHAGVALAALLRAGANLTEAGGETALGLGSLSQWPTFVPKALDEKLLTTLLGKFVQGFTLKSKAMARPSREVEVVLEPNQMRGLLAASLLYATYLMPKPLAVGEPEATILLLTLRKAQELYKQKKGHYLACGPIPVELPTTPTELPPGTCLAELGFKPMMKVHFQLAATVEAGALLLLARGDADGDGEPEVWALEEGAQALRRVVVNDDGSPEE